MIIKGNIFWLLKNTFFNIDCNNCILSLYLNYKLVIAIIIIEVITIIIAY